jgi:hypothetical protein
MCSSEFLVFLPLLPLFVGEDGKDSFFQFSFFPCISLSLYLSLSLSFIFPVFSVFTPFVSIRNRGGWSALSWIPPGWLRSMSRALHSFSQLPALFGFRPLLTSPQGSICRSFCRSCGLLLPSSRCYNRGFFVHVHNMGFFVHVHNRGFCDHVHNRVLCSCAQQSFCAHMHRGFVFTCTSKWSKDCSDECSDE